ncbi:very long chain fatty acid elongase 4-like isoform X1 [Montipora capricornis]|uniref:very long chain fatty acid elongase 4-like isoform X1 n=2 Tax=Montipora capricornis TaxID=246305 RepID=UPI0035F14FAC
MANITTTVQHLVVSFQSLMDSGDPKTADWPFVSTPWPTISFLAIYLVIVKVGPTIMQKREACNLREVLIIYNFLLVILSVWLVYESVASAMDIPNFNFICPSLPYVIGDAKHNRLARAIYVYWLSKFVESLETVFFILRKKNNQVSFLHVYHHSVMVVLGWTASKWLPGGITFLGAALNSFVHTVMYVYYGLSAFGPHMRQYLWWKRYITKLQLTQFVLLLIYGTNALRINCFENVQQTILIYATATFAVTLVVLFSIFYIQTYFKKENEVGCTSNEKKYD